MDERTNGRGEVREREDRGISSSSFFLTSTVLLLFGSFLLVVL